MPCMARRGEAGLRLRASLCFVLIDSYNSKRNAERLKLAKTMTRTWKGEGY